MKILEKIALVIFSIIMFIVSIVLCLVVFNIIELQIIFKAFENIIENQIGERIILGFSIISMLLAIKALFFPTRRAKKQEIKTGILLENTDGRLLISKDTIENIVNSVVKSFKDVKEVQTKIILNDDNNITVFITLLVDENAVIKDLSINIQNKIKETVKRGTDLDINQVNINIKNINVTEATGNESKGIQHRNDEKIKINNVSQNNKISTQDNSIILDNEIDEVNKGGK